MQSQLQCNFDDLVVNLLIKITEITRSELTKGRISQLGKSDRLSPRTLFWAQCSDLLTHHLPASRLFDGLPR
jgi:hypothetical protein